MLVSVLKEVEIITHPKNTFSSYCSNGRVTVLPFTDRHKYKINSKKCFISNSKDYYRAAKVNWSMVFDQTIVKVFKPLFD